AGGAAELHEPGDAPHTRAVHAVVAGDVRPSISQSEADPEAVVPLRVLRPRLGCGAGKRGEQCDHAGRVHAPSLAGVGPGSRRVPCPKRRARARARGVLARGQANAWGETAYGSDRNGPRGPDDWSPTRSDGVLCACCTFAATAHSMLWVRSCELMSDLCIICTIPLTLCGTGATFSTMKLITTIVR